MRIAMIAHTNAPWTEPYARFLASDGHELKLISFHPDRLPGVDCEFVGHDPFRSHRDKYLFITRVPRVRRILQEFSPDVVLACYIISNGLTAALAWDGPLVVSARGAGVLRQTRSGEPGPPTALRARLLRYICRRATRVHAVSEEIVDRLAAIGVPREMMDCFPLGIDLNRFPLTASVPRGDPLHIICTRRHEAVYQNHVIVDALARLGEAGRVFRCTFVGGGSLLEQCREQIRQSGLDDCVRCVGPISHERIPAWLATAHVYVSASVSDGTSSSLLEALAGGLFPVVSRIRANHNWIREGETGLFFEAGRADQLAAALARVLDHPEARARAAPANRRLVVDRGDRRVCNMKLMHVLEEAIDAFRPLPRIHPIQLASITGAAVAATAATLPKGRMS